MHDSGAARRGIANARLAPLWNPDALSTRLILNYYNELRIFRRSQAGLNAELNASNGILSIQGGPRRHTPRTAFVVPAFGKGISHDAQCRLRQSGLLSRSRCRDRETSYPGPCCAGPFPDRRQGLETTTQE